MIRDDESAACCMFFSTSSRMFLCIFSESGSFQTDEPGCWWIGVSQPLRYSCPQLQEKGPAEHVHIGVGQYWDITGLVIPSKFGKRREPGMPGKVAES